MRFWRVWAFLVAFSFMGVPSEMTAQAQLAPVLERHHQGVVNWTDGYLEVTGEAIFPDGKSYPQARLLARRGAIVDAQRRLLEILQGVRVDAMTTVQDFMTVSDIVRTRVEGVVKNAFIVGEEELGDSYRVILRLPLRGTLTRLIHRILREPERFLPPSPRFRKEEQTETLSPPRSHRPQQPPRSLEPLPLPKFTNGPFTSLVVDCRGYGVRPSISPKIRDEKGREIWGTVKVDRRFVLEHGIVLYVRRVQDLNHPAVLERIGKRPLVVRAIGVGGHHRTDPIVSAEDGRRILEANRRYHFLDEFRVIFVIDPLEVTAPRE